MENLALYIVAIGFASGLGTYLGKLIVTMLEDTQKPVMPEFQEYEKPKRHSEDHTHNVDDLFYEDDHYGEMIE